MTVNYSNLSLIGDFIKSHSDTKLLIVTKNQNQEDIIDLIKNGYSLFGENRVQEAKKKYTNLIESHEIKLHLIGPLQSNKAKIAIKLFDTIQSIDRKSIIDHVCDILEKKDQQVRTKEFFIQVNIGGEDQKSGIEVKDLNDLYIYALKKKLNIKGLMCIPPNDDEPSKYFIEMTKIRDSLDKSLLLSMGMSNDYSVAVKHGSNLIRIGSAIFR